jgi:signal transduction histidine kinase
MSWAGLDFASAWQGRGRRSRSWGCAGPAIWCRAGRHEGPARRALLPTAEGRALRLDVPGGPVVTKGDAESLGDALPNLIANTMAYAPAGSPFEIGVRAEGALEVRDRGPGIAPVDLE